MASSAMTLSLVATPRTSLIVPPAAIGAHWGIELDAPPEPLTPSRHLVLRSGAYVIRDAQVSVDSVRWEHDLVSFLAPRVPEVVPPLRAYDGNTFLVVDDNVISVMPYVAAERAKRDDPRIQAEIPRLLARLHGAAAEWPAARPRPAGRPSWRELDWVANETWDWNVIERTPLLERGYSASFEWLSTARGLTESAIHGDFHPDNLFASTRGIEALLDWEFRASTGRPPISPRRLPSSRSGETGRSTRESRIRRWRRMWMPVVPTNPLRSTR